MPMDEMKYGCLFVQSGYEERAIRYIERYLTDYEARGWRRFNTGAARACARRRRTG